MGERTNNQKGLVSVVVVTFKREAYLRLTLQSILNQTFKNIEVIVVSDGYEPEVEAYVAGLVKEGDISVQYYNTEHCGYPAKPRNLALTKCIGEYVAFCDDDDIWELDKLEKQVLVMEEDKDLVLCCTNRKEIDSNGELITENSINFVPASPSLNKLLFSNFISYSSVMIRRSILTSSGIFKDDIRFRAVEDYHLWLRIAQLGKIYFINEILVHYRKHSSNITTKFSIGIKKNILVFNDVFNVIKLGIIKKSAVYLTIYLKSFFYRIQGK